jgi:hypothetical protein
MYTAQSLGRIGEHRRGCGCDHSGQPDIYQAGQVFYSGA